jgi:hypothetical protein
VVNFMPRPHYQRGNILVPTAQENRRLGGLQSPSGCSGVEKNRIPIPGVEPRPSNLMPIAMQTELCRERLGIVTDKGLMVLKIQRVKLGQKYRLPYQIKIVP